MLLRACLMRFSAAVEISCHLVLVDFCLSSNAVISSAVVISFDRSIACQLPVESKDVTTASNLVESNAPGRSE